MAMDISPVEQNFLEHLRPEQKAIYDYVHENPNEIVIIQGYAMTGKTFTLRAIAQNWGEPVNVIIYKHDLLEDFEDIGNCQTMARFFMDMFDMEELKELDDLEKKNLDDLDEAGFILYIVQLIARAKIGNLRGTLVIIDEYTVIVKPLLIVILTLLKHHRIGTILCGDHFQLLNEKSRIMGTCTSYDIARVFADKSFRLLNNESKSESVKIVDYMRELVSDDWLDDFARSLIAAVFQKRLFGSTEFSHTHLAGSHLELKYIAEGFVKEKKIKVRPYTIGKLQLPCSTPINFLSYLPLVEGSSYYVDERLEKMKGELISFEENEVVLSLNDKKVSREPNTADQAIYRNHKEELLLNKKGSIYNFPIYPYNFKTTLKSQGRPVSGPVSIYFGKMTYRELYVAVSRVKDFKQIVKITIQQDHISHLASCVINFEELIDPAMTMTDELLKLKMNNYKYYNCRIIPGSFSYKIVDLLRRFFDSDNEKNRKEIREQIETGVKRWCRHPKLLNPPKVGGDSTSAPINQILIHADKFYDLSSFEEGEREVRVRELLASTTHFRKEHSNEEEDDSDLGSSIGENFSSPMKRGGEDLEDSPIDMKKKMNSPFLPDLD